MPRWYAVYSCLDSPQRVIDDLSRIVRHNDLGRTVTRICTEKKPKKHGEFYLALGIESDKPGDMPRLDALEECKYLKRPITKPESTNLESFDRKQLQSMMGVDVSVEDIARVLQYSRRRAWSVDDPFADPHEQAEEVELDGGALERSQRFDQLMTWLSAMGSGSLPQLRAACVALGLSSIEDGTSRALRRLRVLGHIETSRDGKRWSVAPATLVRSGNDSELFFLAGARDRALLSRLREFGDVEEWPQSGGAAPALATVRFDDASIVGHDVALRNLDAGCASERIAAALPDLGGWAGMLQTVHGVRPEMYDLRRYDGGEFRDVALADRDGFYEFRERSQSDQRLGDLKFTLYRDSAAGTWYRGDWYGLRFLSECRERGGLPVRYDAPSHRLAVMRDHRWPELYERALVLASGRLPMTNGPWLVYEGVSQALLDHLAPRLHLEVDGDSIDA